jgi:hypothetical protein
MVAVAEGLVDRSTTATERNFLFSGQIVAISIRIGQFELRQIARDQEGSILECNRLDRHCYFLRRFIFEDCISLGSPLVGGRKFG